MTELVVCGFCRYSMAVDPVPERCPVCRRTETLIPSASPPTGDVVVR